MKRVFVRRHWRGGVRVVGHVRSIQVHGSPKFVGHVKSYMRVNPVAFQPGNVVIKEASVRQLGRSDALGKSLVHFKGKKGRVCGGTVLIRKGMSPKDTVQTIAHENAHWALDNIGDYDESTHESVARPAEEKV